MVHTAVVLPPDLMEQLKKDSEAAGQGVSTQIRERLRLTYFGQPSRDPKTANLLDAVRILSEQVERKYRTKWHESTDAHYAFKSGVKDLLDRHAVPANDPPHDTSPAGPVDPPDVVGRILASLIDF
jgi:hypothetical protein